MGRPNRNRLGVEVEDEVGGGIVPDAAEGFRRAFQSFVRDGGVGGVKVRAIGDVRVFIEGNDGGGLGLANRWGTLSLPISVFDGVVLTLPLSAYFALLKFALESVRLIRGFQDKVEMFALEGSLDAFSAFSVGGADLLAVELQVQHEGSVVGAVGHCGCARPFPRQALGGLGRCGRCG